MAINEDAIRLVNRLHRLTVDGRLDWSKERAAGVWGLSVPGRVSSAIYVARLQGLTFLLYRVDRKHIFSYDDPSPEVFIDLQVVLEVRDADGDSIQEIQNEQVLDRLFETVRSTVSGLKQRVAELMKEDVTHAQ